MDPDLTLEFPRFVRLTYLYVPYISHNIQHLFIWATFIDLYNGSTLCCLWGTSWIFI